jgi:hypothetical protein
MKKNTPLHTPFRKDINFDKKNISKGAACISLLSCYGNIIKLVSVTSNFKIFIWFFFPLRVLYKKDD